MEIHVVFVCQSMKENLLSCHADNHKIHVIHHHVALTHNVQFSMALQSVHVLLDSLRVQIQLEAVYNEEIHVTLALVVLVPYVILVVSQPVIVQNHQ
jgi:hypothetical protein